MLAVEALHAEVAVVDVFGVHRVSAVPGLAVFHAPAHAVVGHSDDDAVLSPADGAVLGIVLHGPFAGGGQDPGLIAVGIVFGPDGDDVGHILVAVVQEKGRALAVLPEAEGARGEGLRVPIITEEGAAAPIDAVAHVAPVGVEVDLLQTLIRPGGNKARSASHSCRVRQ